MRLVGAQRSRTEAGHRLGRLRRGRHCRLRGGARLARDDDTDAVGVPVVELLGDQRGDVEQFPVDLPTGQGAPGVVGDDVLMAVLREADERGLARSVAGCGAGHLDGVAGLPVEDLVTRDQGDRPGGRARGSRSPDGRDSCRRTCRNRGQRRHGPYAQEQRRCSLMSHGAFLPLTIGVGGRPTAGESEATHELRRHRRRTPITTLGHAFEEVVSKTAASWHGRHLCALETLSWEGSLSGHWTWPASAGYRMRGLRCRRHEAARRGAAWRTPHGPSVSPPWPPNGGVRTRRAGGSASRCGRGVGTSP